MLALLSVSLVALFTQHAYAAVKFAKTYGGTWNDWASSVQQTSDGGYIVLGETGYYDWNTDQSMYGILLIKTDANGNVQWAKIYRFPNAVASYVRQTSDGGYIVAGLEYFHGVGYGGILLIKTDANGNVQWAKIYGGTDDWVYSVQQTSDGGYIVAGGTISFGAGMGDILLIKTDANGNLQWAKTYGGTNWDDAFSVQQTSDGGYIVAGETQSFGAGWSDFLLIKTDANGSIGSCSIVRNASPTETTPSPTVNTPSPSISSPSPAINSPSPTVTSPTLIVSEPCPSTISESCQPVSGLITPYKGGIKVSGSGEFEVKVYNVSGVMVKSVKGTNEVKLELSRGVYFVDVVSGGKVIREKVIIR
jgi:hypothetical protein